MIDETHKRFIKLIEGAARRRSVIDTFGDAVHLMAQAMWKPFALGAADEVEADWQRTRDRYDDSEYEQITEAFAILIQDIENNRREFLGTILETIGAANVHNGQFLTPSSVARMMAGITGRGIIEKHKIGEIITLHDPACGASVLLIEQAEEMLREGIPQGDMFIVAGDIDLRSCDMSFVEMTLLGYAARVDHMNGLSMEVFSPSRYTAGYFLHCMPMRLLKRRTSAENPPVDAPDEKGESIHVRDAETPVTTSTVAQITQGKFDF